ncbi:peroxisomal biogenesis factor 14 [Lycorma delicatula]|uniref:peroxisomal biogenesis factor 14 n=1 Tax=Lycorma delicatula TaxID=130591 RepID=UPI003F5119DB
MDNSNKTSTEDDSVQKNGNPTIRDSLVNTAVQFLQNPNTKSSPLNMKKEFLKKKGLTDEEIESAIQKSGIMNFNQPSYDLKNKDQIIVNPPMASSDYYYSHQVAMPSPPPPPSKLIFLRDLANTVVVLSGAAYLIYCCYKKYIEPFLFGSRKKSSKKDPLEMQVIKLKEVLDRVNSNVERLEAKLDLAAQSQQSEDNELLTEINSLKGLLLNRKQFPATPQTSSNVAASIPTWQLSENQPPSTEIDSEKKPVSSPSNSSNNSTNNDGSDSSLEMIKIQEVTNNKN